MRIGKSVCHSSFQESVYMQPGIISLCVSGNLFASYHFNNQYICSKGPFPYTYREISLPLIISTINIYVASDHFPMRIGKSVCHSSFQQSVYMQPGTISLWVLGNQFATHHFNNQFICSQGPFPYAYREISLPLIISTISIYAARDHFPIISGNQFATHHFNNQYICSQGPFPYVYREISLPLIISTISIYVARDHFPMYIGKSVCHSSIQRSVYLQPGTISLCILGNQFATHHFNNQ